MTPPPYHRLTTPMPWALSLLLLLSVVGAGCDSVYAGEAVSGQAMSTVAPFELRGDLRALPLIYAPSRPYRSILRPPTKGGPAGDTAAAAPEPPIVLDPMPATLLNFAGMSFSDSCGGVQCGTGWPANPNGDVGLNHYIQAVNDAYAIYSKAGTLLTSFDENALFATAVGTPCAGNSQGDPIVLFDQQANRWILTNLAFARSSGVPVSPFYQCIAVSKTSDPVSGGWWIYAVRLDPGGASLPPVGALNDYPKFGIWTDCLYMSANEFDMTQPGPPFIGTAFAAFSRADLYAGGPVSMTLGFINNATGPSTMIPSNLRGRGQSSLPPPGTPNYYVSESTTAFEFEVRKFTVGANCAGGTLGAPTSVSHVMYTQPPPDSVPQPGTAIGLDPLDDRLMQKVQYRRVGDAESLWVVHTVKVGSTVRPHWAEIDVSGGVVGTTPVQQDIYAPDTTLNRWMGSIAADRQGNVALGYSTSNDSAPNFPSIAYAGRLAIDPPNTLPQTEVQLIAGAGSQTNNCGGVPCHRWGDYTAMSVDPVDDCRFWYTNEYYSSVANGASGNWQTRIGAFKYPACRPLPVFCCQDFTGTSTADILWRNFSGSVALWTLTGTTLAGSAIAGTAGGDWTVVGLGDFNGDGRADILWRNSAGLLAIWLMNGSTVIGTGLLGTVGLDWTVEAVADVNLDGRADILWRHSTGTVAIWLMNGTTIINSGVVGTVGLDWTIWGVGDFNADGRADILWRHDTGVPAIWLINGLTITGSGILSSPGPGWSIAGVGDFNGDNRADILWRHDDGTIAVWFINGTAVIGSGVTSGASADWRIVGVADFNLDAKADILWRHSAGNFSFWLMNGATIMSIAGLPGADSDWQVQ
jgi:hypothetical protein